MTTIEHTIPTGETFTFTVAHISADDLSATVCFDALDAGGPDVASLPSSVAYPTAAIEAAVSQAIGRAVRFGESRGMDDVGGGRIAETWMFRSA